MKIIRVNETDVTCSHEVKADQGHRPAIHLTVAVGELSLTHVLNIGSVDEPIPAHYDQAALQKDLDAFRRNAAAHLEGKLRARQIAEQVT